MRWMPKKGGTPFDTLGVDGGELGELLGGHGLLSLQHIGEQPSAWAAAIMVLPRDAVAPHGEGEPVERGAVAVLGGARRRGGRLCGAVTVGAGAGAGDLLHVHERGEEVVLGADLVEASAVGVREAEGHLRSSAAVVRPRRCRRG